MNKFNAKTNILFLAVILVAGTFASITPSSFIIGEAQAAVPYGMDDSYRPTEYQDNNNYNKLKDNVSIEKIKCNNININFLGNNTGDINLSNNGQVTPTSGADTEEGYSNAYSSDGERYNEGYNNNKEDIGFVCTINNNNTNFGGNQTISKPSTCEECFTAIPATHLPVLNAYLAVNPVVIGTESEIVGNIEGLCNLIQNEPPNTISQAQIESILGEAFSNLAGSESIIDSIIECLLGLEPPIITPSNGGAG